MIIHRIKNSFVALLALSLLALPVFLPSQASAQISEETRAAACEGLGSVGDNCAQTSGGSSVSSLIASAVNILSFIVGVAAVIMLIIGGIKYVTSNGDSNSIASAKNTVLYAIIGLVVALLAQGIVQFVFNEVTTEPAPAEPESSISAPLASLSL